MSRTGTPNQTPIPSRDDHSFSQDDPNFSLRLRHAIENKFPYPIASSYYQLRHLNDWRAEVPQMASVLGVTLQHLVVMVLSDYLSSEDRNVDLNEKLIEIFCRPVSHGTWLTALRLLMVHLRDKGHSAFVSNLSQLFFHQSGQRLASLEDAAASLVQQRNTLVKRSAESLVTPDQHHVFKRQLVQFLQSLAFLTNYPIVAVKDTQVVEGVKSHSCYLLTGFDHYFEQATLKSELDLEKMRVLLLNPETKQLLDFYPFYVLRECPQDSCREIHLFRFERIGRRRIDYVTTHGHRLDDAQAADTFRGLLKHGFSNVRRRYQAHYMHFDFAQGWHQLEPQEVVDRRYEIVRHLRRGGMADVYEVRDRQSGELRALKLLPYQFLSDRKMLQRFHHEAMEARELDHPNVTKVLAYGEAMADHYLIMELADGWTNEDGELALDVGELSKPQDEKTILSIVKQACEGLDYIHRRQIVHRDIKPGNLLLFRDGRTKLADFGIARSTDSVTLTMTGLTIGTPEYMSPEQAEGKRDLTPASDTYSLGAVTYELLTGQPPFKRNAPLATALAHVRDALTPPRKLNPSISVGLQKIVMTCLKKDPKERFRHAKDLFEAIADYERQLGGPPAEDIADEGEVNSSNEYVAPQPAGIVEHRNSNTFLPRWLKLALAIVVLVGAAIAVVWWLGRRPVTIVNEAKWHPNAATLARVQEALRKESVSIDKYILDSHDPANLREAQIYFDTKRGTLLNIRSNIFIKVFVPDDDSTKITARWMMTNLRTPEIDPSRFWNRGEFAGPIMSFEFANSDSKTVFESIVEKLSSSMPQEILTYIQEKSVQRSDLGPRALLGVHRLEWHFKPADGGSSNLKLQCTQVYAIPYDADWMSKLAGLRDVPLVAANDQWKWNEIEAVEEGVSPTQQQKRFSDRVAGFEENFRLNDAANKDVNAERMQMAKYATAVELLGLFK